MENGRVVGTHLQCQITTKVESKKLKVLLEKLKAKNKSPLAIVRAPGRANIIGEHIDYCDGIVLPFSIEQSMYFVAVPADSAVITINAEDYQAQWRSDQVPSDSWMKYFDQILSLITEKSLSSKAWDVYFTSDIPIGAGVSSSSALCLGFLYLLNEINQWQLDDTRLINLASDAEHGVGLLGGKMDQYAIVKGMTNQALILDCIDHSYKSCDVDSNTFHFVLVDSGVKHALVNSEYNTRRKEVELGLELVQQVFGEEISYRELEEKHIDYLFRSYPLEHQRLRHVFTEIQRVASATQAIRDGRAQQLGNLLSASHLSLRDDYQVSCKEIDFIVDQLNGNLSVYGARMMGGCFGGSVIALLKKERLEGEKRLREVYQSRFEKTIQVIPVSPSSGLQIFNMEDYV